MSHASRRGRHAAAVTTATTWAPQLGPQQLLCTDETLVVLTETKTAPNGCAPPPSPKRRRLSSTGSAARGAIKTPAAPPAADPSWTTSDSALGSSTASSPSSRCLEDPTSPDLAGVHHSRGGRQPSLLCQTLSAEFLSTSGYSSARSDSVGPWDTSSHSGSSTSDPPLQLQETLLTELPCRNTAAVIVSQDKPTTLLSRTSTFWIPVESFCVACVCPHRDNLARDFFSMPHSPELTSIGLRAAVKQALDLTPNLTNAYNRLINAEQRFAALTIISEINDSYGGMADTIFDAINLVDRLAEALPITAERYILATLCCWYLAYKNLAREHAINLRELMDLAATHLDMARVFNLPNAIAMEGMIGHSLNWRLTTANPATILCYTLPYFTLPEIHRYPVHLLATEVLLHISRSINVLAFPLHTVALAVIRSVFDFLPNVVENDWQAGFDSVTAVLSDISPITFDEVRRCSDVIKQELQVCEGFQQYEDPLFNPSPTPSGVSETFGTNSSRATPQGSFASGPLSPQRPHRPYRMPSHHHPLHMDEDSNTDDGRVPSHSGSGNEADDSEIDDIMT